MLIFFLPEKHEFRSKNNREIKIKKNTPKKQHVEYRIFVTLNFGNCLFTKMTCDNGKMKFQFQINCAGCRLHVYRNTWSPKIGQNLVVRQEVATRSQCQLKLIIQENWQTLTSLDTYLRRLVLLSLFCQLLGVYWGESTRIKVQTISYT